MSATPEETMTVNAARELRDGDVCLVGVGPPNAAANLEAAHRRRHETFAHMIRSIPEDRLRQSWDDATDTAWAIGSIDVYLLLQSRGWDAARYARWIRDVLVTQLLAPT